MTLKSAEFRFILSTNKGCVREQEPLGTGTRLESSRMFRSGTELVEIQMRQSWAGTELVPRRIKKSPTESKLVSIWSRKSWAGTKREKDNEDPSPPTTAVFKDYTIEMPKKEFSLIFLVSVPNLVHSFDVVYVVRFSWKRDRKIQSLWYRIFVQWRPSLIAMCKFLNNNYKWTSLHQTTNNRSRERSVHFS